jgi:hypothetical protein
MGCGSSAASVAPGARGVVGSDGKADITLAVPKMPLEGGIANVITPDGVHLQFCVPMGYPSGTLVNVRYTPLANPKAAPKAKLHPHPKHCTQYTQAQTTFSSQLLQTVEAKIVHPLSKGLPILPQQFPKWDGSWHWIRHENDDVSRLTRCDAAELLMETFKKGGFSLKQGSVPGKTVKYTSLAKMIKGTQILSCSQTLPQLGKDPQRKMELEYGRGITPMEKAATMVLEGYKPACVNAASAYHRGGGFTSVVDMLWRKLSATRQHCTRPWKRRRNCGTSMKRLESTEVILDPLEIFTSTSQQMVAS